MPSETRAGFPNLELILKLVRLAVFRSFDEVEKELRPLMLQVVDGIAWELSARARSKTKTTRKAFL